MKNTILILTIFIFIISCGEKKNKVIEKKQNKNIPQLTACECAELLKKNPFNDKEKAAERDPAELQKEWNEIWKPCANVDNDFMLAIVACANK